MDISHQLTEVCFIFADVALVTVLEEVPDSFIFVIEIDGICGKESTHHIGDRRSIPAKQQMKMIWNQSKSIYGGTGFTKNSAEAFKKETSVLVVIEDRFFFNASGKYVVMKTWYIDPRSSGHGCSILN